MPRNGRTQVRAGGAVAANSCPLRGTGGMSHQSLGIGRNVISQENFLTRLALLLLHRFESVGTESAKPDMFRDEMLVWGFDRLKWRFPSFSEPHQVSTTHLPNLEVTQQTRHPQTPCLGQTIASSGRKKKIAHTETNGCRVMDAQCVHIRDRYILHTHKGSYGTIETEGKSPNIAPSRVPHFLAHVPSAPLEVDVTDSYAEHHIYRSHCKERNSP